MKPRRGHTINLAANRRFEAKKTFSSAACEIAGCTLADLLEGKAEPKALENIYDAAPLDRIERAGAAMNDGQLLGGFDARAISGGGDQHVRDDVD